ncbi:hypothetical protein [Phenylobacterium sp. SCN 70-31]|uniref:hypothetical protein n=1 Tax=Phenylobacterium sp. SCN 70-31 TaxID=1660129 RepID=UPI000868AD9F|nr:hypothetical protein [Phenylobacterium sp. SCN 70-31]ODT88806.1 MAG: hypothetical protein ABS78_06515 [Phenylobacterium sp. SCN 70-31]
MRRRDLIAAAPALAVARAAHADDLRVRGSDAYSESAMVMSVARDGSSALTLRFCRFPVQGFTWLWCHLLHEGRLYAFTRHDLPAGAMRLADEPVARWRAPGADAELLRTRRHGALPAVRLAAKLGFHDSRSAPHGEGPVQGRIDGRFQAVSPLSARVLEGREEVYGLCRARVEIGGRTFEHEGLAKFHEQRQAAPRFDAPFNYAFLAGDGLNATTLLLAQGATGGWQVDGAEAPLADMTLDPPGASRGVAWRFRDAKATSGRLEALTRYEIPIYGRAWQGSFVRGDFGGRPIVGAVNDWLTPTDIYALAATRAQKLQSGEDGAPPIAR